MLCVQFNIQANYGRKQEKALDRSGIDALGVTKPFGVGSSGNRSIWQGGKGTG